MPEPVNLSAETRETPPPPATAINEASSLRELAALLQPPDDQAPPAETQPPGDKPAAKVKPKTLNDAAERLGLKVEDLYGLEIPSDKIKGLTLGQLKDHMAERENFTTRSLQFEEDAARKDAEFGRATLELQTLLAALPKDALKPEVREAIRQKTEAAERIEIERTLQVIPEWSDVNVRTTDVRGMIEHLSGYGFEPNYLAKVKDHRTLKFIRASWQREQRIQKALALVSEKKPGALGNSKPNGAPQPKTGSKPMSRQDQEAARYLQALAR
jgi:hypothetical protein